MEEISANLKKGGKKISKYKISEQFFSSKNDHEIMIHCYKIRDMKPGVSNSHL